MISRAQTREKLQEWLDGSLTAETIWHWAMDIKDTDEDFEDGLVQDVVDVLVCLPQDLITLEEAEVMLYGLNNPADEADLAQNLLWNHMDSIDTETRRLTLAADAFYAPFCGAIG